MNHLEYAFSPGQVANLSGVSVDVLRDWRRRDLLGQMGEQQENRRWQYNLKEVIELAIARQVLLNVPSVPHCLYVASRAHFSILYNLHEADGRSAAQDYKGFASNYLLIWTEGELDELRLEVLTANTLAELEESAATNAIFVDTRKTASALNDTLKNVIRYGLARPGVDGISVPSVAT